MHTIELLDAEALRLKLARNPDPAIAKALAYYDDLKAKGGTPALYLDRGQLVVGTMGPLPFPCGWAGCDCRFAGECVMLQRPSQVNVTEK